MERVSKIEHGETKKSNIKINNSLPELLSPSNKVTMALVISVIIAVLGVILVIPCIERHDLVATVITSIQVLISLLCFIVTISTKKTTFFTIVSHVLIYFLAIFYLVKGGIEGFGIYWLVLELIFSVCYYSTLDYLITNTVLFSLVMIFFFTPIKNICYPFSIVVKVRFPLLFISELGFLTLFRLKASRVVSSRNTYFDQLKELQNSLEHRVEEQTKEIRSRQEFSEKMMLETITALAGTIDAKDKYTNGHSKRVAEYSKEIAKRLNKDNEYLQLIYMMGLLHDIGKIGVPDTIINKTDKLTNEEYEIIKTHCEIGSNILREITTIPQIGWGARWHHERYDGKGFPDKLKAEDIPEMARIICVADSYDAMTSNRSYRLSLDQQIVRSEIVKGRGSQFDPVFADIMLQMIDEDKDFKMHV